jgi:hypothetical protein
METESSLPSSQKPIAGRYREPDESSLYLPVSFLWGIVACTAVTMQRPRDKQTYRAVSRQGLVKNVPAVTDTIATMV